MDPRYCVPESESESIKGYPSTLGVGTGYSESNESWDYPEMTSNIHLFKGNIWTEIVTGFGCPRGEFFF